MSAFAETHDHFAGSNKLFISVWVWLLLLTSFEVFLGYIHLNVVLMLVILMGASIIKAALIVAYFMHLRFERVSLSIVISLTLVLALILVGINLGQWFFHSATIEMPSRHAAASK